MIVEIRVIRTVADIAGSVDRALFWYLNSPIQAFGDRTAEQLVAEGRTEAVLRYLAALEIGWAG
jgi:hypothetical protein